MLKQDAGKFMLRKYLSHTKIPWKRDRKDLVPSDRKDLVPGQRNSSRWFRQNPRLVAGKGRASGRNENYHDGRSDYMPGLRTRMDTTSGRWIFLKKQECWEGHEQALITTIRKETIRTQEFEEAG